MNKEYRLLVLDYGGVYSFEYDMSSYDKIMMRTFGRTSSESETPKVIDISTQLAANKISVNEYIKQVSLIFHLPKPADIDIFEKCTISYTFNPSPEMVKLVQNARASGLHVALLSDMYDFEIKKTRHMGRFEGFDRIFLSADVGMTKSQPEIFELVAKEFDIPIQNILFVDDKVSNINTAKRAGLGVLHADKSFFKSPHQLSREIRRILAIN